MSYNTIDENKLANQNPDDQRAVDDKELTESIITSLCRFIEDNDKLMHLNLTGCNFGKTVETLAKSIYKSPSLQAIHLCQNEITEETREVLLKTLCIPARVSKT